MNETMNNKLLQQLIHAPSLWDDDFPKFEKTFVGGDSINVMKQHEKIKAIAHSDFLHNNYKNELLDISNGIQQSAKFKINAELMSEISEKDFNTVLKDIKPFLPFQKNYVEVTLADGITALYLEDVTESYLGKFEEYKKTLFGNGKLFTREIQEGDLIVKSHLYIQYLNDGKIAHIPCPMFTFFNGKNSSSVRAWEKNKQHSNYINFNSQQVADWAKVTKKCIYWLQVLLSYPSLAKTQFVSGRKPIAYNKLGKYKSSTMNALPKWEHKVLTVDLYASGSSSGGNGQGNGKRFHAVRKHLRQLNSGKKVFVKPHFRGDKNIGVVEKDYLIKGEK